MHPQAVQAVIIHGLHVSDVPKDTPSASAPPVSLPINQTVNLQLLVHSPVQHGMSACPLQAMLVQVP